MVKLKKNLLTLFFLTFSIAFGIVASKYIVSFYEIIKSTSWNETECIILEASIKSSHGRGMISVSYKYKSSEGVFTGDRYKFCDFGKNSTTRKLPKHIKVGAIAPCFYDPLDHQKSVIRRLPTWDDLLFGLLSLFIFSSTSVITVGCFFEIIKRKKRPVSHS